MYSKLIEAGKTEQSSQIMDLEFWRAAQQGNWDAIIQFPSDFYTQQTGNGNTILHVLAACDSSADAVKHIISQKPKLVFMTNAHRETPLVIASRKGHSAVVRALIDCAKEGEDGRSSGAERVAKLLEALDEAGNTALHEAVRNNHHDVVKLMLEEVPDFKYGENFARKSPLYVAVERGNLEIVRLIFSTCKATSYDGPGKKTTVLHAAALLNSPECMKLILEGIPIDVTKKKDEFGWTALHYAAKLNHTEMVKLLLSKDRPMGYIKMETDHFKTALHIAAASGYLDVMREILLHCPDCWEMVTGKRQNILHLAVENEHNEVMEFILQCSWAAELINKKDVNGNTPLHLYVATKNLQGNNLLKHPCVDKNAFNHDDLTPLDMIILKADKVSQRESSIRDELVKAGGAPGLQDVVTKLDETSESSDREYMKMYMVVATLIVTVSFAAGFTVPGGYDNTKGNEGMAVLGKKTAFAAFVVSDSCALFLSTVALLFQLFPKVELEIGDSLNTKIYISGAMTFLVIAFTSGLYAILPNGAIKIYLVVVGSLFSFAVYMCLGLLAFREVVEEDDSANIGGIMLENIGSKLVNHD